MKILIDKFYNSAALRKFSKIFLTGFIRQKQQEIIRILR